MCPKAEFVPQVTEINYIDIGKIKEMWKIIYEFYYIFITIRIL